MRFFERKKLSVSETKRDEGGRGKMKVNERERREMD